jgi:hypothetical protein
MGKGDSVMPKWRYRHLAHGRNNMVMTSTPYSSRDAAIRAAQNEGERSAVVALVAPDGTETPWEEISRVGGVNGNG